MNGNYQIKPGEEVDTGRKYIDVNGEAYPIYRKMVKTGALPNNTTGNVAHGITGLDVNRYSRVVGLHADNGTTVVYQGTDVKVAVNATNIVLTTVANLSTYHGNVEIEYCKTGGTES